MSFINLHSHSVFSDGTLSLRDMMKKVQAVGLEFFSLTDHDSVEGWRDKEFSLFGHGIKCVSGVEISTSFNDNLHILGYGFDVENENFLLKLAEYRHRRIKRIKNIAELLKKTGVDISGDLDFKEDRSYGRPHVADILRKRRIVGSRKEAFKKYMIYGKPAYVPSCGPSIEEAIKTIKAAGGYAVLAHPGAIKNLINMDELKEMGLDGIEAYYPSHSGGSIREFMEMSKKFSLFVTAGTDYHGPESGRDDLNGFDLDESLMGELRERFL